MEGSEDKFTSLFIRNILMLLGCSLESVAPLVMINAGPDSCQLEPEKEIIFSLTQT